MIEWDLWELYIRFQQDTELECVIGPATTPRIFTSELYHAFAMQWENFQGQIWVKFGSMANVQVISIKEAWLSSSDVDCGGRSPDN